MQATMSVGSSAHVHDSGAVETIKTLSARLREGTHGKHAEVSHSPFSKKLSEGSVTEGEYKKYLAFLDLLYPQLEFQLNEWKHVSYIEPFTNEAFAVLFRSKALEHDMQHFHAKEIDPGTAAKEYGMRLAEIALHKTHLLIAHVYMRYLGDLFGGRAIYENIKHRWPEGMAFYQYPHLENPKAFIGTFKEILDSLKLDEAEQGEILEEVLWSYDQHLKIFNEISTTG